MLGEMTFTAVLPWNVSPMDSLQHMEDDVGLVLLWYQRSRPIVKSALRHTDLSSNVLGNICCEYGS